MRSRVHCGRRIPAARNRQPVRLVLVLCFLWSGIVSGGAQALPPLPSLTNFSPAIRKQFQEAYATAASRPRDPEAVGRLGMIFQTYEDFAAALICYTRAAQLAPDEFRWLYYQGIVQARLGDYEQAAQHLRAAIAGHPDALPARLQLAEILLLLKNPTASDTLLREVTRQNSASPRVWYTLGKVRMAQGDGQAAIDCFEKALKLSPHFGAAQYALALALRDAGRFGRAREALATYPQDKLVRPSESDPWLEAVAALNLGTQTALNKGLALEAEGDLAGAIREHEEALNQHPELLQAHVNLIQLYGRSGNVSAAEAHYRSALALNPQTAEAHYNYGVLLIGQGKFQAALAAFEQALAITPGYAEAHYNRGLLLLRDNKLDAALSAFQAALAAHPALRAARFELGRIYVHRQQFSEAIEQFQQILTPEDADTPRYLYSLGATYARVGNREKSVQLLQEARSKALTYHQQQLLTSIERDLKLLTQDQ